ncbi:MAG: DNA polymerase I, partial [Clostridia bacterium]|nr:DNA polymerase I [Clostridia bacterium]
LLQAYLINNTKVIKDAQSLLTDYGFSGQNLSAELLELEKELKIKIDEKGLNNLYYNIELPLIACLFDMERQGLTVDMSILNDLDEQFSAEIDKLTDQIHEIAGEKDFNINSNKQLADILFGNLGLKASKKNKTGYSVSAEVLEELEHPIIDALLRYRQLSKLKSTYIDGMKQVMNKASGRVHTDFKQCLTTTGRLSSNEPNLQNIPVRTAEGREIRKMFVAKPGNILISADYSQIELRLLTHFSQEPNLLEAYNNNGDVHALTASKIFRIPLSEVTSAMRRSAKAVNFGIIYGISGFGLAKNAGVSNKQAKVFIDEYFATYPKVKEYMDANVALAKKQGYLRSLAGRVRFFPELTSPQYNIRAFGERAAMNFPLQGSASDIIKIAMLRVYDALKAGNYKAKLILQVHDELIVEAPEDERDDVIELLKQNMENAVRLSIPLNVGVAYGRNWYDAK